MPEAGDYQDCYVAFLDILGFRQLVERSVYDVELLQQLSGITSLAATPQSGMKQTSLGPCPMQVRAFSDSMVVFTPTAHANGNACNPLGQLCFVVRYLHDRILELDACIRGGLTIGKMYWHPSWSDPGSHSSRGSRGAQSITFGPGMNAAYDLESKLAVYPRVLIDASILHALRGQDVDAWPFAERGALLNQTFRTDRADGKVHLDLLNAQIVRAGNEAMHTASSGFTITWEIGANTTHHTVISRARQVATTGIQQNGACERVRQKYEWLRDYAASVEA